MSDLFSDYGQNTSPKEPTVPHDSSAIFANYPTLTLQPLPPDATQEIQPAPDVPAPPVNPPSVDEIFALLDTLVGLEQVKAEFRRLRQFARVQSVRQARNLPVLPLPRHAVFYSLPGAGKTTIARLYGLLLRTLGVLRIGHVIETDRLGLVGGNYNPTTAEKTRMAMQRASGGVLFIDDAQALYKDDYATWDAGGEVIQLVLERLHQPSVDFALIFGGFPDQMKTLLLSHDGLRNLLWNTNHFHFADYDPAELQEIFDRMCQANSYTLTPGARKKMKRILTDKYKEHDPTFGNARYVAGLFQAVTQRQSVRLGEEVETLDDHALSTLLAEDVARLTLPGSRGLRSMGFMGFEEGEDE